MAARDLPRVSDLIEPNIRAPLSRVIEEVQKLAGFRGDPEDKAITVGAAMRLGWIDSPPVSAGTGGGSGGGTGGGGTTPDLTPPPTATGLLVSGGFSSVIIRWDAATYTTGHGPGQTNIYAVKRDLAALGTLPVFGDASIVATVYGAGNITALPSELNTRWYVWIKFKSADGVEATAPTGGTNGVQADTGQDVTQLLGALTGAITETQLYTTLGNRINLIDGPDTLAGSVAARILAEATARGTAITTEQNARIAGDNALASSVTTLTASVGTNAAAITNEATARANADSAISTTLTALASTVSSNNSTQTAALATEATTRASADSALSTTLTSLSATVSGNNTTLSAALAAEATTRANADAAQVSSITTLQARVAARPNLLANGGFAQGKEKWSGPRLGDFVVQDGAAGRALYSATIASGTNAIQHDAVPATAGEWYTIHGDAEAIATSGVIYFDLLFFNSSGVMVGDGPENAKATSFAFANDDSNRQAMAVEAQAPPGTASAVARFVWQSLTGCTGLGVRMVKLERGRLPYTSYSQDGDGAANYAALVTEASARAALDGSVSALYTVRAEVSAAGRTMVGGFGFSATSTTLAGPRIDFGVRADRFWVAAPSTATGVPDIVPFTILTTPTVEDGVTLAAGIYMDSVFMRNVSALIAKFGVASIDDAKIASLSAAKITAGALAVGQYVRSTGYVAGTAGYNFDGSGNFEINNLVARGTIYASAGTIGGITLGAGYLRSPGYVPGTTGFQLKSDDTADFGSGATFAGTLVAAGGSFRGTLQVGSSPAISGTTMTGTGAIINASGSLALGKPTKNITITAAGDGYLNGKWVTDDNLDLASLTATIPLGDLGVGVANGDAAYGTRSVSVSGGKAPYNYLWSITWQNQDNNLTPGNVFITGGGASSTVGIGGSATDNVLTAAVVCTVTDANGRSTQASFGVSATHGTPL